MDQKNHNGCIIFLSFPLSTNYPSYPYNHREYIPVREHTQFIICNFSDHKYTQKNKGRDIQLDLEFGTIPLGFQNKEHRQVYTIARNKTKST